MKLGFRGGVNFSNFYNHNAHGEIPKLNLSTQPNNPNNPILVDPNGNYSPLKYYYKTDLIEDLRIGFSSYLFLDIYLQERLSLECGLGYSQKGIDMEYNMHSTTINADYSTTNLSYHFTRNLRLDYIVVPMTFQFMIDKKERFYILGGVYNSFAVNFLINNSLVTINEKTYDSMNQLMIEQNGSIVDEKTYAKIFDAGLLGGFGVNFPFTEKLIIGLDLRSAIGMISIPGKYDKHGFQSFNKNTKNLSVETGIKIQYVLNN